MDEIKSRGGDAKGCLLDLVLSEVPNAVLRFFNEFSPEFSQPPPSTGTPITGKIVCAAITPAKCAARPAPAIITSMPRSMADSA